MQAKYSSGLLILGILSGIVLAIYLYLKKKITSVETVNTGLQIYVLVKSAGLSDLLAMFAAAQSAHETNGYTSKIFKSNNNAFGMKFAGQSTAIGTKNGYANYLNLEESVADFCVWWMKHRNKLLSLPLFVNDLEGYVRFLKNQDYFEADESEYLKGCKYFYNILFGGEKE